MLLFTIPNPPRYQYFVKRWQKTAVLAAVLSSLSAAPNNAKPPRILLLS